MVNPFPLDRGRGGRSEAHHNPMEPFPRGRSGAVPADVSAAGPAQHPRRAVQRAVCPARLAPGPGAGRILGLDRCPRVGAAGGDAADADAGRQLITVIRKGTRAMQQLAASPDAFGWPRLYQEEMRNLVPTGPDQPLWWTLRRPFRQLAYHAALHMFTRAGDSLGKGWTLHDLRHTAAYRMARNPEMPPTDIQWIMGHARLSTTRST